MRFMMLMIPLGYESAPAKLELDPERVAAMMRYNQALKDAGVLITLEGLHPPAAGARVKFDTGVARRDRRSVHRGQGGDRRLLDDRGRLARRGDRVGQQVPGQRQRDHRDPPGAGDDRFLGGGAAGGRELRTSAGRLGQGAALNFTMRCRHGVVARARRSIRQPQRRRMMSTTTFLAVYLGGGKNGAADGRLERAARGRAPRQGAAGHGRLGRLGRKAPRRDRRDGRHRSARPSKKVGTGGTADISTLMTGFTVVRAQLARGRREAVREPPAFRDLPGRSRGDHAGAADPGTVSARSDPVKRVTPAGGGDPSGLARIRTSSGRRRSSSRGDGTRSGGRSVNLDRRPLAPLVTFPAGSCKSLIHMSWQKDQGRSERGYHHGNLKEALLQAALDLISKKGPAGFTFADAARMAGVSPRRPTGISATVTN